jgi:hypothetical protein
MTMERHEVELRATARAFIQAMEQAGRAADRAAQDTKRAWEESGRSLDDLDEKAQRSGRSMEEMQRRASAVGAAFGTMVTGFSLAGQAFVSQEQQIRGLERAYGEAARGLDQFADRIQQSTVYSDDAARQALLTASTVTRQYGIATDQVDDLVQRSADLASVFGFGLAESTSRVTSAIRGEAEAAEALGIAMSDSALQLEAAKRGLTGWNTTMTEAEKAQVRFQVLMEQTAYATGAAGEAADTAAGDARQWVNTLQDATQALGEGLGPLGEYTAVLGDMALALPLVGAGLGKLASGLGAIGGAKALGPLALLLGGGALAYGYSQDSIGTTSSNSAWNNFFLQASGVMNAILPGDPYDQGRYTDQMSENAIGDLIMAYFGLPGEGSDPAVDRVNRVLGDPGLKDGGVFQLTADETKQYIQEQAAASGLTPEAWLQDQIRAAVASDPTLMVTPGGQVVRISDYRDYQLANIPAPTTYVGSPGTSGLQGATGQPQPSRPWFPFRDSDLANPQADAARWGVGPGNATLSDVVRTETRDRSMQYMGEVSVAQANRSQAAIEDYNAAVGSLEQSFGSAITGVNAWSAANARAEAQLREQFGAYYEFVEGMNNANDAQMAFKATQDGLLQDQGVYTQQIGEFSSQQNALTDAYEILQRRQAEGVALSKEEQALLDNYPALYDRVSGGVEDATVQAGLLAAAYIENMEKGDAMNRALEDSTGATQDLVSVIEQLILSLNGVPEEVRTQIILDNLDGANAAVFGYLDTLGQIPANISTTLSIYPNYGSGVLDFLGGGAGSNRQHGGVVPAAHGRVLGQHYTLVGEAGPELLVGGQGGMVIPASASRMDKRSRRGGDGGMTLNNCPITVIANDPRQFVGQMREFAGAQVRP